MNRTCANCGAEWASEARFCRKCGAPLRVTSGMGEGAETVSPQAATIPLTDDVRTTDGLATEDPRRQAQPTARVGSSELERMLRRDEQPPSQPAPFDPYKTVVAGPQSQSLDAQDGGPRKSATTGELVGRQPAAGSPPPAPRPADGDEDFDVTRPANAGDFDDERTVLAARQSRPFETGQTPARVQPTPPRGAQSAGHAAAAQGAAAASQSAAAQAEARRRGSNVWPVVIAVCAVLLIAGVLAGWLALRFINRAGADGAPSAPAEAPTSDARAQAEERLTEAESLMAAGDLSGALERLREAVRLDPTNARAHRRLGDVLLETGDRRGGIEELRAATQYEPNDFTTWRALAAAQLAEGLPADAVESYRRLLALTGEGDPTDQLAFADSLRLAGRGEEARAVYQRLAANAPAEVAAAARQHLSELTSASPTPTPQPTRETRPGEEQTETASTANTSGSTVSTQPTPAPAPSVAATTPPPADMSPAGRYERGQQLWRGGSRGAAVSEFLAAARGGVTDANYFLGLNLVEGKDVSSLKRAEIVAALGYFQRAQSGSYGAQSRRYVQQLEREFDRIRSQ
ncbi:MAG TPA: tetratricopeptide repeat protein [Pyrinomonadaceae bacterium]|nr:tetratricopeptide repeat protein [Pyrinomonadaceae bacterium]